MPKVGIEVSLTYTALVFIVSAISIFLAINNLILFLFGIEKGKIAYVVLFFGLYIVGNFILEPDVIFRSLTGIFSNENLSVWHIISVAIITNIVSMLIAQTRRIN